MAVSMRKRPGYELRMEDVKIKQILKFKWLGSVLTVNGESNTEVRKSIGIAPGKRY